MSDERSFELPVARRVRERLGLGDAFFTTDGRLIYADLRAARVLAERLNALRDLVAHPERAVSAGALHALGLLDETFHVLVSRYLELRNPSLLANAYRRLSQRLGEDALRGLLAAFLEEFPPAPVFRGELSPSEYLAGVAADGTRLAEVVLEELLILWLLNVNPAAAPLAELFDDTRLRAHTPYLRAIHELRELIAEQPGLSEGGASLLEALRAPAVHEPLSLQRQLEYVQQHWIEAAPGQRAAVLRSLDLLAEENRPQLGPGPGPPPVVPDYADLEPKAGEAPEPERFSVDRSWMGRVVLQAKNAHVWLAQLSQRHGRPITTLDQVPDEELDRLEAQGITALWLIGVWERSRASREIKRRLGDHQAEASAYSLMGYSIAAELGGYAAFDDLQTRAMAHSIRLSTDMVPNHVGLDAPWVVERPQWFISTPEPPFPSYHFAGPDLSTDPRVALHLEDHYWSYSDAAVVFKRVERATGEVAYVYHGNDGTVMPWNDTAQLDFTRGDVREAVIQTILHVARHSPVIRFDAAMVLTKHHFHRLWFPAPGSAGAIPSRAAASLSQAEFDRLMPEEFWREVVDRVAAEAPETLLLAEAFWLLEGYFVRSLGMHRVYNSAFMHMLRDELNDDYRQLVKNTLAFDPRILERYVNFMSNPDERTAIDQFGTGDKYFAVATLLATMPGLPMIGHGQLEGLTEKYGMEFIRPRWSERVDRRLLAEHERRLFPLLRRRRLFAAAERFQLFDLIRPDGSVDDNVVASANQADDELTLVVVNNADRRATGWLRASAPVRRPTEDEPKRMVVTDLATCLRVTGEASFLSGEDAVSGSFWLLDLAAITTRGLALDLEPYEARVLWRVVPVAGDDDWPAVAARLAGRPTASPADAVAELALAAVLDRLVALLAPTRLWKLGESWAEDPAAALSVVEAEALDLLVPAVEHGLAGNPQQLARAVRRRVASLLAVRGWAATATTSEAVAVTSALTRPATWPALVAAAVVGAFVPAPADDAHADAAWFDRWQLPFTLARAFELHGHPWRESRRLVATARVVAADIPTWLAGAAGWTTATMVDHLAASPSAAAALDVVAHEGRHWFDRRALVELLDVLLVAVTAATAARPERAAIAAAHLAAGHDLRLAATRVEPSLEDLCGAVAEHTVAADSADDSNGVIPVAEDSTSAAIEELEPEP